MISIKKKATEIHSGRLDLKYSHSVSKVVSKNANLYVDRKVWVEVENIMIRAHRTKEW